MNKVSFRQLTATEYDALFAIVSQIKEHGARELTLTFDDIKHLIRWDKSKSDERFIRVLSGMYDKIISLKFDRISDDGNIITKFVVFSKYSINKTKQEATVAVSPDFWDLFNLLFDNFTTFMLDDLVYLSTSYGKELFRNIKQFRTTGHLYWSIQEFRKKLVVPKSFTNGKAFQRIFGPTTIKQLKTAIPGFEYVKRYSSHKGRPVIGVDFYWHAEEFNEDYLKRNSPKKDYVKEELLKKSTKKFSRSKHNIPLKKIGK
ncbi:replication initiation protein [Oenococcus alcoholitolerans]